MLKSRFHFHSSVGKHFSRTKKILCVARNYRGFYLKKSFSKKKKEHAKELSNPIPTRPVMFLKPPSSLVFKDPRGINKIEIPKHVQCHHEVELGVIIGRGGRNILAKNAQQYIKGFCVALDLTARNVQTSAKNKGLPWTEAKGFDTFTPVSEIKFIEELKNFDFSNLKIECFVNGKIKQSGNTKDMIFDIPNLIQHFSGIMTLEEDDLILTGTPEGVGPLIKGDKIKCQIEKIGEMEFDCVERSYPEDYPYQQVFGEFF